MACYCGHQYQEHNQNLVCGVEGCTCAEYDEDDVSDSEKDIEDTDYTEDDLDAMQEEAEFLIDGVGFADPGGKSALRAVTPDNPRNLPCPTCGRKNVLTPLDVAAHYQCDRCADRAESGMDY
jgi:hypothetical protein